jgi:mannitol-1-/sugar-/sorbitol-6-/2-deoxyglucose-6-phosphatase
MRNAAIFDMDGVLLDSEPYWQESEISVFGRVGISLTREQCMEFTGVPVNDVVAHRFREMPWSGTGQEEIARDIIDGVIALVEERGTPLPGASEAIDIVRRSGSALGLASSSSMRLIRAVLKRFGWEEVFDVVHSAETEECGKPHPAVFLTTARRLGVTPADCGVIEDSFHGLIAAKAARMRTIIVPSTATFDDPRFAIADLKLRSLTEFTEETWHALMKR